MTEIKSRRAFAADARTAPPPDRRSRRRGGAANGALARRITQPTKGESAIRFTPQTRPSDPTFLRRAWLEAFRKDAADVAEGLYPVTEAPPADLSQPFPSRRGLPA